MTNELCSTVRIRVLEFLIQSAQQLEVPPIVKYSALSLFAERFYPIISRFQQDSSGHWLLQPVRESNLQLFSLIAIWISSKIEDARPLSVKKLKMLADKMIQEQHYTTRDFAEAEVIFMQVLDFEIGTSDIVYRCLEDLLIQLKEVAAVPVGDHLDIEVCMDIMDLLYEKEETSTLYNSPHSLAASILVASYAITVPRQRWEFPVLPWVKYGMACKEDEIIEVVRDILKHVLQPCSC